ncbi:MAG: glycosyltransferase, partial [bacterium]
DMDILGRLREEGLASKLIYEKILHSHPAAARNRGLAKARGTYILYLGDDIVLAPDALSLHLDLHRRHESTANSCPLAILGHVAGASPCPSKAFEHFARTNPYERIKDPNDCGFLFFHTTCISLRRELLQAVGGLDEKFAWYGWEDIDLGYRLERDKGLKIRYCKRIKAEHRHPQMSLDGLCNRERLSYMALAYFLKKHPPSADPRLNALVWWTDIALRTRPDPRRRERGKKLIRFLESYLPLNGLLRLLYERLISSYRIEGIREGHKILGRPRLDEPNQGKT